MVINNYCYEARKNGVVSLLYEKHMHAVVYGLISCLIRHSKEGSLIYWSVFQVSHFGSSLQAGQCMQQQHYLKAATIYATSTTNMISFGVSLVSLCVMYFDFSFVFKATLGWYFPVSLLHCAHSNVMPRLIFVFFGRGGGNVGFGDGITDIPRIL